MRWLRYDRRIGSWLALAALALQLCLSFGHVHLDAVRRIDPTLVAAPGPQAHSAKSLPAQQPGDDTDNYCAISQASIPDSDSFVPAAPVLPVPLLSHVVEHFDYGATGFIARRRLAFQSRAPPLA